MTLSIVHRITGIANYAGTVLLVAWLAAAALGEGPHAAMNAFFGSWFGQLVLFGYTWSLIHHMLGGCVTSCGISSSPLTRRGAR